MITGINESKTLTKHISVNNIVNNPISIFLINPNILYHMLFLLIFQGYLQYKKFSSEKY